MKNYVEGTIANHWFDYDVYIFCINGSVTSARLNVMGKGCGKDFARAIPSLPSAIGEAILRTGLHCQVYQYVDHKIIAIPNKTLWFLEEDRELIKESILKAKEWVKDDENVLVEFPLTNHYDKEMKIWLEENLGDNYDVLI